MSFLKKILNQKADKTGIIFIVEDNLIYAKTLEAFLKSTFPHTKEIKIFSVGETCLLEIHRNPDLIIIDYFLNTKYPDAETGIEIIKKIRDKKPEMNIIVLSSQKDIYVALATVEVYQCSYIKKDSQAFDRIEEIIKDSSF